MYKYIINGGKPLRGSVSISGAKNAVDGILPAALMVDGVCRIENVPRISDVSLWMEIFRGLGVGVRSINQNTVETDARAFLNNIAPYESMRKMRASYYLIGALLGRFGRSSVAMPGGCDFGVRPIDQHIKAFEAMGAEIEIKNGIIHAVAKEGHLVGAHVYFDVVTVGATINAMLAATLAHGVTVLENSAKEPHVVDVANFLNSMGADIKGAGTDIIKIRGVDRLHSGTYAIIPDQIEAGTFMAIAAATASELTVTNVIPKHLECISAKLVEMGVTVEAGDDWVRVSRSGPLRKTALKTLHYPGFPTDMQPQMAAVLCLADGTSIITEGVWDNRYKYVDELKRMGASIQVDGKIAVVEPISGFSGAPVRACDLRAGAALIIAGLAATGVTEIDNISHIERGYEDFIEKLQGVGADIKRARIEEVPARMQA